MTLRERINSGVGFISSQWLNHGSKETIFAMKYKGKLPDQYPTVTLTDSPITTSGVLATSGKTNKVEALGGQVVAGWLETDKGIYPAILLDDYGAGKTVYLSFDLGLTLNEDNYEQVKGLIANSVSYVHKVFDETTVYQPNQIVPVTLDIKSLGGVLDFKVTKTFSSDLLVYDPVRGQFISSPWVLEQHLATDAISTMHNFIIMPEQPGSYSMETEIGFVVDDEYYYFTTVTLAFEVVN